MLGVLAAPDLAARLCRDIKALFTELLPAARRHESALAVGSIDGEPGHCKSLHHRGLRRVSRPVVRR
jgi:hypothetical protein